MTRSRCTWLGMKVRPGRWLWPGQVLALALVSMKSWSWMACRRRPIQHSTIEHCSLKRLSEILAIIPRVKVSLTNVSVTAVHGPILGQNEIAIINIRYKRRVSSNVISKNRTVSTTNFQTDFLDLRVKNFSFPVKHSCLNVHQGHGTGVLRVHYTSARNYTEADLGQIALLLRVPTLLEN